MTRIYCVICRAKTDTDEEHEVETKNKRFQIKGKCAECKTRKCQFTSKKLDHSSDNTDLKELYYNPETGLSGINDLQRQSGKSQKQVTEFLQSEDVPTRYKTARKNYPRERIYVHAIDEQWQADLIEMHEYAAENKGYNYILTVQDCFSKYAWALPVKNKNAKLVSQAFYTLFKERIPRKIQTDKGKEFFNAPVSKLFTKHGINHFSTQSDKKAAIVERLNRTIKERLEKLYEVRDNHNWLNVLDDVIRKYNNTKHCTIKMTPIEGSKPENSARVEARLYPSTDKVPQKPKFKVGDTVRISKWKSTFTKGYKQNFTTEIFTINKVLETSPPTYELKDYNDEIVTGKFYEQDLSLYNKTDNDYEVEKVLKTRTRKGIKEDLVKWVGYPPEMNSWIPHSAYKN